MLNMYLILDLAIHSSKVDVVLLNDTWIERVEINELVPKTMLRFKNKPTLILVPLPLTGHVTLNLTS